MQSHHLGNASKCKLIVYDIVRSHVPSQVIIVRSQDKPWFDDSCRRAYQLKQEAYNRWRRSTLKHDFQMFVELTL